MPYRLALLSYTGDDLAPWIEALEKRDDVVYEIIHLGANDWLKKCSEGTHQMFLIRSPGVTNFGKQIFDERVQILSEVLGKSIYPGLNEIRLHENKKYLYAWLEAHDLPHPCTKVFCDKTDAKYYASNLRYPIVAKLNIGSSGKGVRILKDQSEATSYINRAFSKGIRPRIGPNLRTASLLRKLRNAFSKKGLLQKRVSYYKAVYSEPQKYVIFQEFIKHSYEWRVVVIGESYFAHKKLLDGNKASGSLMKNYDNPPLELLDFVKSVCRRTGISSASLDIFETDKGWLINEIQTYFGQSDPYQMLVDGKAGRYRDLDGNWVFEPGDWASNQCYDLRMQHVIDLLQKKV